MGEKMPVFLCHILHTHTWDSPEIRTDWVCSSREGKRRVPEA